MLIILTNYDNISSCYIYYTKFLELTREKMKKTLSPILASAFALFLLLPVLSAVRTVAEAAGAARRNFNCFMKELDNFKKDELDSCGSYELTSGIEAGKKDEAFARNADETGKKIYEAHKAQIDGLISRYKAIINEPIKTVFSENDLAALSAARPNIDFKYTRGLARALMVVAYHLGRAGRPEDAVKLLTIVYRFGQIVAAGDGEPPALITHMIGISVKNVALKTLLGAIMVGAAETGAIKPEFFREYASALARMDSEEMAFIKSIETESRMIIHIAEKDIWENPDEDLKKTISKIGPDKVAEAKKVIKDKIARTYEKTFAAYSKYETDLVPLNIEIKAISDKITEDSKSLSNLIDPFDAVANIILSIAYPNMGRAYEQYLFSRLHARGVYLLARLLAARVPKTPWPADAAEFEKASGEKIPADIYTKKPCAFKKIGGDTLMYSFGPDGRDNNCDEKVDFLKKDVVLMRLPPLK